MSENVNPGGAALDPCSLASAQENTSGRGKLYQAPDGVAGWSWGAFALSWIWAIGNGTWLGLLAFIPGIGLIVRVLLGIKGREWAWQNKRWESLEHFNRVQRRWSVWGIVFLGIPVLGIVAAIAIPAYQDYTLKPPLRAALTYANETSSAVDRYFESHRVLPESLDEIHLVTPRPADIQNVVIDPRTGQLKVTLDVGRLHGQAFYLAASIDAEGKLAWRCLRGDVPKHLMPEQCKYDAADPFNP